MEGEPDAMAEEARCDATAALIGCRGEGCVSSAATSCGTDQCWQDEVSVKGCGERER